MRPLPELTAWNEWFWTSGEDGRLRVQGCADCQQLFLPPGPICPNCRSTSVEPKVVSGKGHIAGFTINAHQWHPDFTPPYVIAVVALQEDSEVRLTTNIVGCEPSEVRIGQEVEVTFEHAEDVWIPLFKPTGGPDESAPIPEPTLAPIRPAISSDRFEHKAVLSGVGRSKIGRRLMVDPLSLTVDACLQAVADAGLTMDDIDGLSTYPGYSSFGMSEGGVGVLEDALRVHPTWINGGGELPGQGGAVIDAAMAVAAGICRHVLCFRTVWESSFATLGRGRASTGPSTSRVSGSQEWRAPYGAMSAASWIGIQASHYMHRFGATKELLGAIAINGRTGAGRNPAAIYRDPLSMDDYMSARPISTPFGLYDCDIPCDGAVAVIVSDASVAGDLPKPAIRIEAVGTQIRERVSWDQGVITHEPQTLSQAGHLWSRSSLTPDDVDVALLYDGFSFNAVSWIEALGFCGIGEAQDWINGGKTIALDGDLPLNPHGGQLSEGRLHGFGFIYEAITQLRNEAGERQVRDAKTAVVSTGGGVPSGAMLLQRDGA